MQRSWPWEAEEVVKVQVSEDYSLVEGGWSGEGWKVTDVVRSQKSGVDTIDDEELACWRAAKVESFLNSI